MVGLWAETEEYSEVGGAHTLSWWSSPLGSGPTRSFPCIHNVNRGHGEYPRIHVHILECLGKLEKVRDALRYETCRGHGIVDDTTSIGMGARMGSGGWVVWMMERKRTFGWGYGCKVATGVDG